MANEETSDKQIPVKRLGVRVLTIVFLETGQMEVTGPMNEAALCRDMLDAAHKIVNQVETQERILRPGKIPVNLKS